MKLVDLVRVLRSKNAGPATLTLDIMFIDEAGFRLATASPALSAAALADRYQVDPQHLRVIHFPEALAIKVAMTRKVIAGSPGDRDVYGAQQHGPLLEVEL